MGAAPVSEDSVGAVLAGGCWLSGSEVGALDAPSEGTADDGLLSPPAEVTGSVEGSGADVCVGATEVAVDAAGMVEDGPGAVGWALEEGAPGGVADAVVVVEGAGVVVFGSVDCEQLTTPDASANRHKTSAASTHPGGQS